MDDGKLVPGRNGMQQEGVQQTRGEQHKGGQQRGGGGGPSGFYAVLGALSATLKASPPSPPPPTHTHTRAYTTHTLLACRVPTPLAVLQEDEVMTPEEGARYNMLGQLYVFLVL